MSYSKDDIKARLQETGGRRLYLARYNRPEAG